MARLITALTRLEAWIDATEVLLQSDSELNVILSIDRPGSDGPMSKSAAAIVDEFLRAEKSKPLHSVAETIFPAWEYRKRGFDGMSDTYADVEYPQIKEGWGTYAYRMLRRRNGKGDVLNPLADLIAKMKDEASLPAPKSACYELGIAEGAYDLPLYITTDDQTRRMGGPCLSHLSFKYAAGAVHLTALYRSHEYRYKTLGNLLGLARLQGCVAQEVGAAIGTLVVHSTYAWLAPSKVKGRGKPALAELLARLRDLTDVQAVPA
jgi:hypothetical protein